MKAKLGLRDRYEELKLKHEVLLRSALNVVAAYDPQDPEELSALVYDLGIATGCSSQWEAIRLIESAGRPVSASSTDLGATRPTMIPKGKEKEKRKR